MPQYDIWLDLRCTSEGTSTTVCTLFSQKKFPIQLRIGESFTFWSDPDEPVSFDILQDTGILEKAYFVSAEIEDLSYSLHSHNGIASFSIYLRFWPVQVATIADAQKVVAFLSKQHDFAVDNYSINRLTEGNDAT